MSSVLVVGDCHVTNGQDLRRFDWLSSLIADVKPQRIVLIGDFLTMNCLSAWDMNKRKNMEGRRYQLEIEAGKEALNRLLHGMTMLRAKQQLQKVKMYNPELIYIEGNHEERLTRYLENDPTFEGQVSIESDLRLSDDGWLWVPYRSYYVCDSVGFTHVPFNKRGPICGADINKKCADVTIVSCVYGHTHEAHYSNYRRHGHANLQHILNIGCFFEESHDEDYAEGRIKGYWRGVIMLDLHGDGQFDFTTISITKLQEKYK